MGWGGCGGCGSLWGVGVGFWGSGLRLELVEPMIGRDNQKGERRFEHLVDFEPVDRERERRIDQRDQRGDAKTSAGQVRIEPAERLDEPLVKPDLLPRFAESRLARRLTGVNLAAGKGDLPGMSAQM